jgi:hypothetical protein
MLEKFVFKTHPAHTLGKRCATTSAECSTAWKSSMLEQNSRSSKPSNACAQQSRKQPEKRTLKPAHNVANPQHPICARHAKCSDICVKPCGSPVGFLVFLVFLRLQTRCLPMRCVVRVGGLRVHRSRGRFLSSGFLL